MHTTNQLEALKSPKIRTAVLVVAACRLFDVSLRAIQSHDLRPDLVAIRSLILYVAKRYMGAEPDEIGRHLSRNPDTVTNAYRVFKNKGESGETQAAIARLIALAVQIQDGIAEPEFEVIAVPRARGVNGSSTRALRPSHAIGEEGSPEWFRTCDEAFRSAMVKALMAYKAERDAARDHGTAALIAVAV